jgi:tRNA pseudouridine38-40 synthase
MAHYKLILAYDGTRFQGYQRQGSKRTVQSELESTLRNLGWQGRSILSAGRTDTGVHAEGQVAAFDLDWQHEIRELQRALNSNLPDDISVREVSVAPEGFHPRFDASGRVYAYRIFCDEVRDPLREYFSWRVWPSPDPEVLRQAAGLLLGQHDFRVFGSPMQKGASTERIMWESRWTSRQTGEWVYEIRGNAFLYHMVRRTVFLLVRAGQRKISLEDLEEALRTGKKVMPGMAPPNGLTLVRVDYETDRQEFAKKKLGD